MQARPRQVSPCQIHIFEIRLFQVEPRVRIRLLPRGDGLCTSFDQLNMFGICHQRSFYNIPITCAKRPASSAVVYNRLNHHLVAL